MQLILTLRFPFESMTTWHLVYLWRDYFMNSFMPFKVFVATIVACLFSSYALADNVCLRTGAVRDALEAALSLRCDQITKADLSQIQGVLNLSRASITSLQKDDFQGLTSLTSIDLVENHLTTIPDGIFQGLKSLKDINLGYNELPSLPANLFKDVVFITEAGYLLKQTDGTSSKCFSGPHFVKETRFVGQ